MNYGTIRNKSYTMTSNTSSNSGTNSHPCEYEIHRLCQEQILKQRQKKHSHIVSYRYLINSIFFSLSLSVEITRVY
jgi:hypothetical protein